MTDLAPHSTHLPRKKPRPGWWRLGLLAGLGVVAASSTSAQVQVGVTRAPSVSVDLGVLEDLGPAPNLPGLFGASHPYPTAEAAQTAPYRPVSQVAPKAASAKKQPAAAKRVAHRKPAAPQRAASSPQRVAAVSDGSVRLVAPTAASANGAREDAVVTTPTSRAMPVAAVGSPVPPQAPMPKLPQAEAAPPPPTVPPAPAHDETAASPPSSPAAQATPDHAPTSLTATPPAPVSAPAPATVAPAPAAPATAATANPSPPSAPSSPVQLASAASAGVAANSVKFIAGATDLPSDAPPVLNKVAEKLLADDTLRIQLIAHATGNADQAMEARRVSLARAVAVRAYLIDKGVRSLRMDVRALGNRADDGPAGDQVDLLIISQ